MNRKKISRKRHIFKTITWRITATLTTFLVTWAITGSLEIGLGVGSVEFFIKMVLYYLHERIWYKSKIGVIDEK